MIIIKFWDTVFSGLTDRTQLMVFYCHRYNATLQNELPEALVLCPSPWWAAWLLHLSWSCGFIGTTSWFEPYSFFGPIYGELVKYPLQWVWNISFWPYYIFLIFVSFFHTNTIPIYSILFHCLRFSDGHHMAWSSLRSCPPRLLCHFNRADQTSWRRGGSTVFWVICGMWICQKMGEIKIAKLFSKLLDSQKIDVWTGKMTVELVEYPFFQINLLKITTTNP
jgi:hypothetical protein